MKQKLLWLHGESRTMKEVKANVLAELYPSAKGRGPQGAPCKRQRAPDDPVKKAEGPRGPRAKGIYIGPIYWTHILDVCVCIYIISLKYSLNSNHQNALRYTHLSIISPTCRISTVICAIANRRIHVKEEWIAGLNEIMVHLKANINGH